MGPTVPAATPITTAQTDTQTTEQAAAEQAAAETDGKAAAETEGKAAAESQEGKAAVETEGKAAVETKGKAAAETEGNTEPAPVILPPAPIETSLDTTKYPVLLDGLQFFLKPSGQQMDQTDQSGGVGNQQPQHPLMEIVMFVRTQFMYNMNLPCLKLNALESNNYKTLLDQFTASKNTNVVEFLKVFFQMAFVDVTNIVNYVKTGGTDAAIIRANNILVEYINHPDRGGYEKDTKIAREMILFLSPAQTNTDTPDRTKETGVVDVNDRTYIHILKLMDFIEYFYETIQSDASFTQSEHIIAHYFTTYHAHFTKLNTSMNEYYGVIHRKAPASVTEDTKIATQSTDPQNRNNFTIEIDTLLKAQNEDRVHTYIKLSNFGKSKNLYNERYKIAMSEPIQDGGLLKVKYNDTVDAQSSVLYNEKNELISTNNPALSHTRNYLFGRFTDIFTPDRSNDRIVEKMHAIRDKALAGKPVFIFGYGASGSGKTSSLIYYAGEDGIITKLCNQFGTVDKYTKLTMVTKEFQSESNVSADHPPPPPLTFSFKSNNTKGGNKDAINPSFVLDEEPCNPETSNTDDEDDQSTQNGILELDTNKIRQHHAERTGPGKKFAFDCEDKDNKTLGYLMMYLVDRDRLVKATTNNPNSSRSHMMIHIRITKEDENVPKEGENVPKEGENVPIDLFIGDFGGVENQFMCNDVHTLSDFINIKRVDDGQEDGFFYQTEPEERDEQRGGAKPPTAAAAKAVKGDVDIPKIISIMTDPSIDRINGIKVEIESKDPWSEEVYAEPVDIIDSTTTQFKYSQAKNGTKLHTGFDYLQSYDPKAIVFTNVVRSIVPLHQTLYDTPVDQLTQHVLTTIQSATERFKTYEAQKVFFKKRVLHIPDHEDFKTFKEKVMKMSFGVMTYDDSLTTFVPIQLDNDFMNTTGTTGLKPVYDKAYIDTDLYKQTDGTTIDYTTMFKELYGEPIQTGYKVKKGTNHFYTQYQRLCRDDSNTKYPFLEQVKDAANKYAKKAFCSESDKGTDKYLVTALGGKYDKNQLQSDVPPDAMVEVRSFQGIHVLKFNDFEQYKRDLTSMKSYADFFEKYVPEKKKPTDPEPKHRLRFYLPNEYFFTPEQKITITKGIPEIPYIHKVDDMATEYGSQLKADPVYPTLIRNASRYVTDSEISVDENIQATYVLLMCIIVKVYLWMIQTQHRFEYGKRICGRRAKEGEYINRTLKELRDNIDMIMSVKNENVLYYSPDYVVECFDKYCPVEGRCFTPSTPEPQIITAKSEIIEWMYDIIRKQDAEFDIRQFYRDIMVCIFCTFNLTRNSNNPPSVYYIDHHRLKYLIAKQDLAGIQTEIGNILAIMPTAPVIDTVESEEKDETDEETETGSDTFPMKNTLVNAALVSRSVPVPYIETDTASAHVSAPVVVEKMPPVSVTEGSVTSSLTENESQINPSQLQNIKKRAASQRAAQSLAKVRADRTKRYGSSPLGSNVSKGGNGFIRDANRALASLLHDHNLYPRVSLHCTPGNLSESALRSDSSLDVRQSDVVSTRGGAASSTKTQEEYKEALYRSISPEIYQLMKALTESMQKCIDAENQGGRVAVALVSNVGETTKESRRSFGSIQECSTDLTNLVELIDIHNAATPIGTLEFVDSVSKLNRVQNICYDYDRELIDLVKMIPK